MADDLDSIVKGAPDAAASRSVSAAPGTTPIQAKPGDPLHHTPSSPAMVYLNLLILEASLRAQFLELRARRRHHTFFLALLLVWVAFFAYRLFLAPREDGHGVGGSIYWAVEGAQRVCFMGGIITAVLVWATGIWDRGVRWPRRWFAISNRGLRAFNCKLVVVRRPWWAEALSVAAFFLTYGLFSGTPSSSYRHVDPSLLRETERQLQLSGDNHPTLVLPPDDGQQGGHEEDLAPGGDYVQLLLLAKPFSPVFRENWELYRTEYWERENERRALLRAKVKEHDRRVAKQAYGWLWWLPWRRGRPPRRPDHPPKSGPHRPAAAADKVRKRRSSSLRRPSVSSSRSQTPTLDADDGPSGRRASSASNASDKRRKKLGPVARSRRAGTESRSVTPEIPSPLAKEAGVGDDAPAGSDRTLRSSGAKPARDRHQRRASGGAH